MNYEETCKFLFSCLPMYQRIGKAAYKSNLDTTIAIDNYFGNPHKHFASVHIAGTNGKGSVAHILSAILQKAGYKTALYSSPHLLDFRERIKINKNYIPQKNVIDFVEKHYKNLEKYKPSFFELSVAMAFDYFAQEKVDIAIIETGMGGRLDSTNIINPKLSIITNISKDHTQFLGNTLPKIAMEKAGIIKRNTPVVVGEQHKETADVFTKKAKELNAEIYFAQNSYSINYATISLAEQQIFQVYAKNKLIYQNLHLDLSGEYQKHNLITVLKSIDILNDKGLNISKSNIYEGCKEASKISGLQGRWQTIAYNPRIVCDTGHNEAGISAIFKQINKIAYKKLHVVFGVVNDKNIDNILALLPQDALYYFCKASIPRALNEDILQKKATSFKLKGQAYETVNAALQSAKNNADKDDFIFVGGSTFVVADCLEQIASK